MKNKKNKKVFSIVALVASFVLCIGATFGITLAYFGGSATANLEGGITLKTGIEIGAAIESTVSGNLAVPGQPIAITATGTVTKTTKGTPTDNVVPGLVRAKLTVGDALGTLVIDTDTAQTGTAGGYWKLHDGYYYLVTAADGDVLKPVSADQTAILAGNMTVSTDFDNTKSGASLTASVIFEVAQGELWNGSTQVTGDNLTITNAIVQEAFTAVAY